MAGRSRSQRNFLPTQEKKRAIISRFSAPLLLLIDNLHALGRRSIAMSDRLPNRQTRLYREWLGYTESSLEVRAH
jgi:hypothetical protein